MNLHHRQFFALVGDQLSRLESLLANRKVLWVTEKTLKNGAALPYSKAITQLGQEWDWVVLDALDAFPANALGVISGTIRGGGGLILLLPEGADRYQHPVFFRRMVQCFHAQSIPLITSEMPLPALENPPNLCDDSDHIILNDEQLQAVEAVKRVLHGHRRRPLVLTADRGRGKSTALGVAADALLNERELIIIVSAPARAMIQPLLNQAGHHSGLRYVAPDQLDQERPQADLVIIDEAGAIPGPLLTRLLQHYSRIVFSTTTHGYEGNGRGFAIRFQHQLTRLTPSWNAIKLQQAVRWGNHDPLEHLVNELLLLDAEPSELTGKQPSTDKLKYQYLSREDLLNQEPLLRQLFGLLVTAHYQTRPSDLLQLLDNPALSIHILSSGDCLLAVALVSREGGLDPAITEQIYQGKRRPAGHLVPQILSYQLGLPEAAKLTTDRIMRIAVHPDCQQQGLGKTLLASIKQQSTADYLSTSFGISAELLYFWQSTAYNLAHLGLKREASSGYHSAIMLCPLTPAGKQLQRHSVVRFNRQFVAQLSDALKHLEPDLALKLLMAIKPEAPQTDQFMQQDIHRFANAQVGYDLVIASLSTWLPAALSRSAVSLSDQSAKLLILRVLQHHDWAYCCQALGLNGKQQALQTMQNAVAVLAGQLSDTDYPRKD